MNVDDKNNIAIEGIEKLKIMNFLHLINLKKKINLSSY